MDKNIYQVMATVAYDEGNQLFSPEETISKYVWAADELEATAIMRRVIRLSPGDSFEINVVLVAIDAPVMIRS